MRFYKRELFEYALQGRISSKNNYARVKFHFQKTWAERPFIYWSLSIEQITGFSEKKH